MTVSQLEAEGILLVQDGNHGEYRPRSDEFCEDGTAFIRAADFNGFSLDFQRAERISAVALARISKGIGKDQDTILSTKGTVGKIAYVPAGSPAFVCSPQTSFWRSLDTEKIRSEYIFLQLQSPDFLGQINSRKGETDMADYLSLTAQRSLNFSYPDIGVQDALVKQLFPLFEAPNALCLINQQLELIAQAIFTSWFVNFEPVKAKATVLAAGGSAEEADRAAIHTMTPALKAAYMDSSVAAAPIDLRALAAAFPSELVDSQFGPLPKGWKLSTYSEMLDVRKGLSYKGEFLAGPTDGPPMINLGCFGGSGTYCTERLKYYSGPYKPRHIVRSGALLVANTDMTQNRIILGSPIVAPDVEGDLLFTHHTFAVDFKADYPERKWKAFAFYSFLQPSFRKRAEGFATGTTVLAMPQDALGKCEVTIPSDPCIDAFNALLYPIWDFKSEQRSQIRSLTDLRDFLLPKFLSGEMEPHNA